MIGPKRGVKSKVAKETKPMNKAPLKNHLKVAAEVANRPSLVRKEKAKNPSSSDVLTLAHNSGIQSIKAGIFSFSLEAHF